MCTAAAGHGLSLEDLIQCQYPSQTLVSGTLTELIVAPSTCHVMAIVRSREGRLGSRLAC